MANVQEAMSLGIPKVGATGKWLLERSLPPDDGMVHDDIHLQQQRGRVSHIVAQRNKRLAAARRLREEAEKELAELDDRLRLRSNPMTELLRDVGPARAPAPARALAPAQAQAQASSQPEAQAPYDFSAAVAARERASMAEPLMVRRQRAGESSASGGRRANPPPTTPQHP